MVEAASIQLAHRAAARTSLKDRVGADRACILVGHAHAHANMAAAASAIDRILPLPTVDRQDYRDPAQHRLVVARTVAGLLSV